MAKPNWLSITPTSGSNNGSFDISCENNDDNKRTGTISVSGGG